jgi:hypothetical protein
MGRVFERGMEARKHGGKKKLVGEFFEGLEGSGGVAKRCGRGGQEVAIESAPKASPFRRRIDSESTAMRLPFDSLLAPIHLPADGWKKFVGEHVMRD